LSADGFIRGSFVDYDLFVVSPLTHSGGLIVARFLVVTANSQDNDLPKSGGYLAPHALRES